MDSLPAFRFVTVFFVDFLKPTPIDAELVIRGQVKKIKGRKVVIEAKSKACTVMTARAMAGWMLTEPSTRLIDTGLVSVVFPINASSATNHYARCHFRSRSTALPEGRTRSVGRPGAFGRAAPDRTGLWRRPLGAALQRYAGSQLVGLEVDGVQHAKNQAHPQDGLQFLAGSAEAVPFGNASFDAHSCSKVCTMCR